MKNFILKNIKSIIIALMVIGLFIFSSWLSQQYAGELSSSVFADNIYGALGYFLISIVSVVIAGLSASPLIPLALAIWGPGYTIFLTAAGWSLGSMTAFWLSRKYGESLACRLINRCDFEDYRDNIKLKNLFWQLLLARIFLPVDVISYAVGLFTRMSWASFFLATLIGSTLFTVLAIYASYLPVKIQIIFGAVLLFVFFFWLRRAIKAAFLKKAN